MRITTCLILALCCLTLLFTEYAVADVLQVSGRYLTTPCGDTIILRGVNKMCIYEANDFGIPIFAEIRKTGANVLRIVWTMSDAGSTPENLDRVIQACIDNAMIPMVELHDATGDWTKISAVVDYWLGDAMVTLMKKHERYLMINVANEPGDIDQVSDAMFLTAFKEYIPRFRSKGITVPLVLDAVDYGQKADVLLNTAAELLATDPMHNLMFSFHAYWQPKYYGDSPALLKTKLKASVDANVPLLIGEFSGCYTDDPNSTDTLWKTILSECQTLSIGWIAWEWGPGNADYSVIPPLLYPKMDMTSDGTYDNIKSGWAMESLIANVNSIRNMAKTPEYIIRKGNCLQSSVGTESSMSTQSLVNLSPNPVRDLLTISVDGMTTIRIYDALGMMLTESTTNGRFEINCANLPSGMYLLSSSSTTQTRSVPFVVLR